MSATLIWIMCAVIVAALAIWLVAVALAARRPGGGQHVEPRRGRVQGGNHLGGGRSLSPDRDAELVPGEDPNKPTVPVRTRGTSPMDL